MRGRRLMPGMNQAEYDAYNEIALLCSTVTFAAISLVAAAITLPW